MNFLGNMNESTIYNEIRLELSRHGAVLFRNNVGLFQTIDGRKIKTGLCKGSSDLIGWYKGRFLAIEVKRFGQKAKLHQQNFIDQVNKSGGVAFVAYSPQDASQKLFVLYGKQGS